MNDNPRANGSRGRDPYAALRLIALIAAIAGVVVLAAAAFVLSYGGIHKIALSAGVPPSVARIFPVIFDAMLVVSCAAVVSLRSAGWWQRTYSWLSTLALLVVVAAADAAHATGTHIPRKPAAAIVAVLPWALLLLAFSLLLSMLRQFRRSRAAVADAPVTDRAPAETAPAAPASAAPGLDILSTRSPAQQPAAAGTTTQPNTMHPARIVADSVPARQTAAGPPEPPAERGEAPVGVASAESGLNGAAPARSADREPPGQDRTDQEPAGEERAVEEQVALEEAGQDEAAGDGQAEPAPEARAQPAEAQPAEAEPAEAQPAGAEPAGAESRRPACGAESPGAQPADAESDDAESPDPGNPGADDPGNPGADDSGNPGTEPEGPEPAEAGSGTIHVPHQAMPAPVPAPSPHFDRLRSTPTPPEDEPDSDS